MKYLLYVIAIILLAIYGFQYVQSHHLFSLPSPSYVACGCGCCANVQPVAQCLYNAKGELLEDIIRNDKKLFGSLKCSSAKCITGTEYRYCD